MAWFWFGFAFVIANAAALVFYGALRLGPRAQTVMWVVFSGAISLAPCLVPLNAKPLRFLDGVAAVCLLWKLYDAHRDPASALAIGIGRWLLYLPNWFWFVLRRVPRPRPAASDWRRVAIYAPLMLASVTLCCALLRVNWSHLPFAIEHIVKVLAFIFAMICIGQTFAALYRQFAGPALDPFDHPFAARTPADFWRRWNQPFREFFHQYVFRPLGGMRHPIRAMLAVFALSGLMHEYVYGVATGRVQGWQMLFFMLQGCAAVATGRIRPKGPAVPIWWAATLAFNLATAALFFRSVNGVIPFYQRR